MVRPDTELVLLNSYQRQFFVLLKVLNWTLPEVAGFFKDLFATMSVPNGFLQEVPIRQWQGRKEKWFQEWRGLTNDEVLNSLAHLPLWYIGGVDTIICHPPTSKLARHYYYFKLNLHKNHTEVRKRGVGIGEAGGLPVAESPTTLLTGSYPQPPAQLSTLQSYHENVNPVLSQGSASNQSYPVMSNGFMDNCTAFWTPSQTFEDTTKPATQSPSTATSFLPFLEGNETMPPVSSNAKLAARPRGKIV